MKSLQRFRISVSPIQFIRHCSSSSSSSSDIKTETTINRTLTEQQLNKINLIIPSLCESNNLNQAIRLADAALFCNIPLNSPPISVLISKLTAESDLTQTMSFLNRLKHNPNYNPSSNLLGIAKMLIIEYFKKKNPRSASKVFNWLLRPDSPCKVDFDVYETVVGLCGNGVVYEGLKVVRAMLEVGLMPDSEIRTRVYMSLLYEAKIKEGQDVLKGLDCVENGGESVENVIKLLDDIISSWVD